MVRNASARVAPELCCVVVAPRAPRGANRSRAAGDDEAFAAEAIRVASAAPGLRAQVRERAASLFDDDGAVDEWARFLERAADQARRDGQSVILN